MVFHWSLSDSKSPQISRTILSILIDLYSGVVRMFFTRLLIAKSSSFFTRPLGIVPSAPITIGITGAYIFHCFFLILWQGLFSLFFFLFLFCCCCFYFKFFFTLLSVGMAKCTIRHVFFFLLHFLFFFFFFFFC